MPPDSDSPNDAIDLTVRQLYDLVWSTPMTRLARTFRRSDSWVARTCTDAGIPLPGRGYWTRKRAGQRAPRRGLRKDVDADEIVLTYYPWDESSSPPEPPPPPPPPRPRLDKDLEQLRAAIEGAGPLPVPEDLSVLHPVVARTRAALLEAAGRGWSPRHGLFEARTDGCLSLQVGEASIDRALRFFEGLVRAALRFGAKLVQQEDKVTLRMCGEHAVFHLRERPRMRRLTPKETKAMGPIFATKVVWEGSGVFDLTLRTGETCARACEWNQGRRSALEDGIPEVLLDTVKHLQYARHWRLDAPARARADALRLEEARAKEVAIMQARREKEEEARRAERLLEAGAAHGRYTTLRTFLDACRAVGSADDLEWLAWAEVAIRRLDPLAGGLPTLRALVTHGSDSAPPPTTLSDRV